MSPETDGNSSIDSIVLSLSINERNTMCLTPPSSVISGALSSDLKYEMHNQKGFYLTSILLKSILDRYRADRNPVRYRFK